jgi:hypothetical protein
MSDKIDKSLWKADISQFDKFRKQSNQVSWQHKDAPLTSGVI